MQVRHCRLSGSVAGAEGWRDESWRRGRGEERKETGFAGDKLIYEFLFLNRDVFRDFAGAEPIWSSRARAHGARTRSAARHSVGSVLK